MSSGVAPQWGSGGKELFWLDNGSLLAANVGLQPGGVRLGRAEPLFRVADSGGLPGFQPSRDGRHFLLREPVGGQPSRPMVAVQNCVAGLR
ncbi:MAG: hypothetical protein NTV52_37005 [Acidobacteria bacterium]|nr:hypothetical protein [Acidobacteriota bacterium]